jgi:hypothetical protein
MWKFIEKKKFKTPILIVVLILANLINSVPKVVAPGRPPPLYSYQFISEVLVNRTLALNLLNSNVITMINSSNYPDNIQIDLNANYTIFNAENDSDLALGLPFSLGINVSKSNFSVKLNNVPIAFVLENYTQGATNNSEFDLDFFSFFDLDHPIIVIKCNLTILKYESIQVEFDFNGLVVNPLNFWDDLYLGYYLNTSKVWNGNTTGKVEFRVLGKIPSFFTTGDYYGKKTVSDIFEGKSCIWEWNNMKINTIILGIYSNDYAFYPYLTIDDIFIIIINITAYILIISAIVYFIVKKKSRKET